jgi:hypothetical protein
MEKSGSIGFFWRGGGILVAFIADFHLLGMEKEILEVATNFYSLVQQNAATQRKLELKRNM